MTARAKMTSGKTYTFHLVSGETVRAALEDPPLADSRHIYARRPNGQALNINLDHVTMTEEDDGPSVEAQLSYVVAHIWTADALVVIFVSVLKASGADEKTLTALSNGIRRLHPDFLARITPIFRAALTDAEIAEAYRFHTGSMADVNAKLSALGESPGMRSIMEEVFKPAFDEL